MMSGRLSSGTVKITVIGCIWVITTRPLASAGLHVVAGIDLAQADPPVDRRDDVAIGQVQLGAVDRALVGLHRARVLLHQEALVVDLLLGDRILPPQRLVALQVGLRLLQQPLVVRELALRLLQRHLVGPRVDLRQEVALLDHLAFLEADLGQLAVDLRLAP